MDKQQLIAISGALIDLTAEKQDIEQQLEKLHVRLAEVNERRANLIFEWRLHMGDLEVQPTPGEATPNPVALSSNCEECSEAFDGFGRFCPACRKQLAKLAT